MGRQTQRADIEEVREHTEWKNPILQVKKPDGSLRLCLDAKDPNQAIKRNQWYSRTVDDIQPELAEVFQLGWDEVAVFAHSS